MPKHPALTCKKGTLVRVQGCSEYGATELIGHVLSVLDTDNNFLLLELREPIGGYEKGEVFWFWPSDLVLLDSPLSRLRKMINE